MRVYAILRSMGHAISTALYNPENQTVKILIKADPARNRQ